MWITLIIIGLIAGYAARLVVPGRDPLGLLGTLALGLVGSFLGGFLWTLFTGEGELLTSSGIIGSIIGAVLVLLVYRAVGARRT